jgi:hypothetical protein
VKRRGFPAGVLSLGGDSARRPGGQWETDTSQRSRQDPPSRACRPSGSVCESGAGQGRARQRPGLPGPKDALNEFVSNATDEYVEAARRGQRIRVLLRRKGRYPVIAVDDSGRGMSADRLREVVRSLFESSEAGDDRTLGKKAIGILALQQLCARCDVVSRANSKPGYSSRRAVTSKRSSPEVASSSSGAPEAEASAPHRVSRKIAGCWDSCRSNSAVGQAA